MCVGGMGVAVSVEPQIVRVIKTVEKWSSRYRVGAGRVTGGQGDELNRATLRR